MTAQIAQKTNLQFLEIHNFITDEGILIEKQELSFQVFGQPLGSAPVVFVIHALTGNSTVAGEQGWWNYLIGEGLTIDTDHYSILAFDIPGNGYSGRPGSLLPTFDLYTARDVAKLFGIGCMQLEIRKIHAVLGGSLGGGIAWELVVLFPDLVQHLFPIASDWKATDWILAHNKVQQEILENSERPLEIARMMAMLFYRSSPSFTEKFSRAPQQVENWLLHHGKKLKNRFRLQAYKTMNHLLSSVDITRNRGNLQKALKNCTTQIHQIGIDTDIFFDPSENKKTNQLLNHWGLTSCYQEIKSIHGHDAFLIEFDQLNQFLQAHFPIPRTVGNAQSDSETEQSKSKPQTINLVLFGPGAVGSMLIQQIRRSAKKINEFQGINLKVIAIANSQKLLLTEQNLIDQWESNLIQSQGIPYAFEDILQYMEDQKPGHLIAIDSTAGEQVSQYYPELVKQGFHIVSANKTANTFSFSKYTELRGILKKQNRQFLYETNVGAGLPLINTIRELHESGEQVKKIRGIFSGSLSYLFNRFGKKDLAFSEILEEARQFGLTEPDPREDLDGMDVARKLLILARELQLPVELHEVEVQSLIPDELLQTKGLNAFLSQKEVLDTHFEKIKGQVPENQVLRYIGEINVQNKTMKVSLESVAEDSNMGNIKGADSIFEIYSESYRQPLIIQGAGAGLEVTARGLLNDILKISRSLKI